MGQNNKYSRSYEFLQLSNSNLTQLEVFKTVKTNTIRFWGMEIGGEEILNDNLKK